MFLIKLILKLMFLPIALVLFALTIPLIILIAPFILFSFVFKVLFGLSMGVLGAGLLVAFVSFIFGGFKRVFAW